MRNITCLFMFLVFLFINGCQLENKNTRNAIKSFSENSNSTLEDGWTFVGENMLSGELTEKYGVTPKYGVQDNYFDINLGKGRDAFIKIIDSKTNASIRYVFIKENSSVTISQIPQGKFYLKMAFGNDWIEKDFEGVVCGKFNSNAVFEKSVDSFDFGKKNSTQFINYELNINIRDNLMQNNFATITINKEEFEEDIR